MRRSQKVWLGIGAIVLAHNLTADDGDTLSEAIDRGLIAYPWLTRGGIIALALHLANAISPDVDPIHLVFTVSRTWRRRRLVVVVEAQPA